MIIGDLQFTDQPKNVMSYVEKQAERYSQDGLPIKCRSGDNNRVSWLNKKILLQIFPFHKSFVIKFQNIILT